MKIIYRAFVCCFVISCMVFIWIAVNCIDEDLKHDVAAAIDIEIVKDINNAYFDLVPLVAEDSEVLRDLWETEKFTNHIFGYEWDEEYVKKTIRDKKKYLGIIDKVISKTKIQYPINDDPYYISPYMNILYLNRLVILSSMEKVNSGNIGDSINDIRKAIQFSQRIKNKADSNLINYMIALRLEYDALKWVQTLVSDYEVNPEDLRRFIAVLEEIPDLKNSSFPQVFYGEFRFAYKLMGYPLKLSFQERKEYLSQAGTIELLDDDFSFKDKTDNDKLFDDMQVILPWYYIHPNQSANKMFYKYKNYANRAAGFCSKKEDETNIQKNEFEFMDFITPNSTGKIWEESITSFEGYYQKNCLAHVYLEGLKLTIFIKQYKNKTGYLPNRLQDLVPEYLSEIPKDPFGGKPLKYSKQDQWVYSVGANLQDNGGSGESEYNHSCIDDELCANNPTISLSSSSHALRL